MNSQAIETPDASPKPTPRGGAGGAIIHWTVVGIVCVAAALVLVHWLMARADRQFQARLAQAPVAELQRIAAKRDWDPEVFYWLGVRLTNEGDQRGAIAALVRATALNPKSAPSRAVLGLALLRLGRPDDAERELKQAIALQPDLEFAHFTLANLYGKYNRWSPAADELKIATRLNPNDLEAQYLLAICYGELYQEDLKMDLLEKLAKREPDNIRLLKSLGYVYLFYGKFAEGEAVYRHILRTAPDDLETHYLLGRALAEQASTPEQFAAAEQELRGVTAKAPNNPGGHLATGILYFRRNQPARAIPELEAAVRLGDTEHKTLLYLGQSYARVGRTADAQRTLAKFQHDSTVSRDISELENRLMSNPDTTPARIKQKDADRLRLAQLYISTHEYSHAMNHLDTVHEHDPNNATVRRLITECQARLQSSRTPAAQDPTSGAAQ